MARIAAYRDILKNGSSRRITVLADFLPKADILAAAAAEGYHGREA